MKLTKKQYEVLEKALRGGAIRFGEATQTARVFTEYRWEEFPAQMLRAFIRNGLVHEVNEMGANQNIRVYAVSTLGRAAVAIGGKG